MTAKEIDAMWSKPADLLGRKVLGCQAEGQCFCTGRCKRTAEEQARHEEWQGRLPVGSPFDCGADIVRAAQSMAANLGDQDARLSAARDKVRAQKGAHDAAMAGLGRQEFEPKPGHGPAPTPEQERADNIAFMDAIANHPSALNHQVGGDHYKTMGEFQPWSVLQAWLTPEEFRGYMKGTAIAYLARERAKGGDQDVSKAAHTLQGLIEMLGGAE